MCAASRASVAPRASATPSNGAPTSTRAACRRRQMLGAATTTAAATAWAWADAARAYGLNKAPATTSGGGVGLFSFGRPKRTYEESQELMRRAAEVRERKELEVEDDAPLTTLKSGLQYREYVVGTEGDEIVAGSRVEAMYKVFRLSSGAYFKYSSGGSPVLLWGRGYGFEGRDDIGDTYDFVLGAKDSLPRAAAPCVVGMRKGGVRRILIPPNLGWVSNDVGPKADSYGASRRLENYRDGPLLLELEIVRVRNGPARDDDDDDKVDANLEPEGDNSYRLPAPPTLVQK